MPIDVTVLMGVSGAGKNHFIENNMPKPSLVVSADDFFMKDGVYKFDRELLSKAHADCFRKLVAFLRENEGLATMGTVVVNNTNSSIVELAPYMAAAGAFGADASILYLRIDPNVAVTRSTHGVNVSTVLRMAENLDMTMRNMPSWWEREVMQWDPVTASYRLT